MDKTFTCVDCGQTKDAPEITLKTGCGGTGYAVRQEEDKYGKSGKVCYDCCGKADTQRLVDNDKECLYLTEGTTDQGYKRYFVSNWCGTFKIQCYSYCSKGRHNIARTRYDVWFKGPDGRDWHGIQYGDNTQIVHCRKLKKK